MAELSGYGRTLVALSGGVDSSVVLAAAVRALGSTHVAAITAVSPSLPAAELVAARDFAAGLGVVHHTPRTDELAESGYRENGRSRCYFCKSVLADTAVTLASAYGYDTIATGTNASDVADGFRPGIAAAAERGARTPLADLGLRKDMVREVARHWGLAVWDKPAAACMASRVAYGISITPARLARVERAEIAVRAALPGVRDLRVRDLGDAVRVEVDASLVAQAEASQQVREAIRRAGFDSSPLTVAAFRSGSMNDVFRTGEPPSGH
ncbi:ATP-dependent sacrificial sulfur transferase LarE [Kutzneria kofuensis]|uniref:Asparagine synthetase domain-containing protein n=1 Tax=Kutzneria kofuensis TaxID=103725 RepID=A0A7W9KSW0_9PSEU|nr:ATP-dependent sacrificial sulfur transferase LarE [Kutzneria kofuensis]MBB5898112.1 uncharacterized protein [Kutzneria kofuensis]